MILKWSKDETLKNLESLQKYIDKNRYYDENILNSIDFYNSILNPLGTSINSGSPLYISTI